MATISLNDTAESVITGKDSVVIIDKGNPFRGGVPLDVTGFPKDVIEAGHVIIRATTGAKDYKPMPLNGGATAYAALPANHVYVGILLATIRKNHAAAAVSPDAVINRVAAPFDFATIEAAVKTALPLLQTRED